MNKELKEAWERVRNVALIGAGECISGGELFDNDLELIKKKLEEQKE